MLSPESVRAAVPVLLVSAPAPEITPESSWLEEDVKLKVLDAPIEIWLAYEAGLALAPSVPDTVKFPEEIVVAPE